MQSALGHIDRTARTELIEARREIQAWEGLGVTRMFVIQMKEKL